MVFYSFFFFVGKCNQYICMNSELEALVVDDSIVFLILIPRKCKSCFTVEHSFCENLKLPV